MLISSRQLVALHVGFSIIEINETIIIPLDSRNAHMFNPILKWDTRLSSSFWFVFVKFIRKPYRINILIPM